MVHYPITPDNIIFTEYNENLKLLNVGYDQKDELSSQDTADDIRSYGELLNEVLDNMPATLPRLRKVARVASAADPIRRYRSVGDMRMAIERKSPVLMYACIFTFVVAMTVLVCYLAWHA